MTLTLFDVFEALIGMFLLWTGIYLVSRNPFNKMYWLVFGFLAGFGIIIGLDPILTHTTNIRDYLIYQKATDLPVFLLPVLYYSASTIFREKKTRANSLIAGIGYAGSAIFCLLDIRKHLILNESVINSHNFRLDSIFGAGPLLPLAIVFTCFYLLLGIYNFLATRNKRRSGQIMLAIGGISFIVFGVFLAISYYVYIPLSNLIFVIGSSITSFLVLYPIFRYQILSSKEAPVFNKTFGLKTLVVALIIAVYLAIFLSLGAELNFKNFSLLMLLIFAILFSHSAYDWFSTFVNDLVYNISSGLSLASDEEVYTALKNYNHPDRLADSSLLRLSLAKKQVGKGQSPVDALKTVLRDTIEYFKVDEDPHRRTKGRLKYHLLKMFVFDEAEEGQTLWELGFDEYPVSVMSRESRQPLFKTTSPSDYFYSSRNAFLALKKEAVQNVAWRISYLEKLAKK